MAPPPKPTKRRTYDAAFRAKALRLASESRSPQAAARALNISPKLLYKWQQVAQTPRAVAAGASLDPATMAKLRQLRALARRQAQELEILKKPSPANASGALSRRPATNEPLAFHRPASPTLSGTSPLPGSERTAELLLRVAAAAATGGSTAGASMGSSVGPDI
jgi:transposase